MCKRISCVVTDNTGNQILSKEVSVIGPFSMKVEKTEVKDANTVIAGRVLDGVLKSGDRVVVKHEGEIIAYGYAAGIEMFGKNLDEAVKDDYIGLVFDSAYGELAAEFISAGDIVEKFVEAPVNPEDIIN